MKIIVLALLWILYFSESSTEKSLEFSEESNKSSISFELEAANEKSIESAENSVSKEDSKSGVIDNDQVFCTWEDVDARDEMAIKLGTELCRFSMVSF